MSDSLRLQLEVGDLVRTPGDVAAVGVFEGERPLRGAAGRVDWRLCGLLSELLLEGRLDGSCGQVVLVASAGRLQVPALLVIGLGPRSDWGVGAYETANRTAFEHAVRGGYPRLVVDPLGLDAEDFSRCARAFVESALAGLGDAGLEVALCVPELEEAKVRRELLRAGRADRIDILQAAPLRRAERPSSVGLTPQF